MRSLAQLVSFELNWFPEYQKNDDSFLNRGTVGQTENYTLDKHNSIKSYLSQLKSSSWVKISFCVVHQHGPHLV